ncbi:MAG: hypothetical protein HS111_16995 [Kofleriaceae bacterium]|nr:hypothetical protein [Kofleriaceae bacterium]MCL4223132.1 hypothetical protein [Myxococcales bacterium]
MKNHTTDPLDVLDVLSHEAGLGAADADDKPTAAELRDLDDVIAFARTELNRQARADVAPVARVQRAVRPSILAMTRDALLARIAELRLMPTTRLAASHRHFAGVASDDDLRASLEDLEALLDRIGEQRR